jgi:hypothetical protein
MCRATISFGVIRSRIPSYVFSCQRRGIFSLPKFLPNPECSFAVLEYDSENAIKDYIVAISLDNLQNAMRNCVVMIFVDHPRVTWKT